MGRLTSLLQKGALAAALALTLATTACSANVYRPASTAGFELDPAAEINDDDVKKAFEAQPQMGKPVRIAYYSFDASKSEELETMLRAQPGVEDVYRLPPLMMTGERRYDDDYHAWNEPKKPFSIKKARLLAARAHCDLLLIFDYGNKVETSANGWVATGVLLVPLLFVPFLDSEVDSYLESYILDTRNGYVYAHVTADQNGEDDFLTIYSGASNRRIADQWNGLVTSTQRKLAQVMASEWERTKERVEPAKVVVPVPSEPPAEPAPSAVPPAPTDSGKPAEDLSF
jgi:hypothetical protein